jgi:transcriptional antiterminator RfaH
MLDYTENLTWFVAQLKPNSHNIAARNLSRQGIKNFLPVEETTKKVRGKFITATRPLFPGYCFVALDIALGGWRQINSTYGVNRLLSFGAMPASVPRAMVETLMLRCDDSGKILPPEDLKPGDRVTLSKGPFADFVATIDRISPDRRVWLLMDIIGGQTKVVTHADHLRLAEV